MQSSIQLIDLLGAAALLLWGLRLIKTGVMRAFGASLRQWIAKGTRNRIMAAGSGFVSTLCLQSSTATAVIAASFAGRNILSPRMAQAVMLGANVGTAIATIILSLDVHWLAGLFILTGVTVFSKRQATATKGLGRAILGLGLMLLALQQMSTVTAPLRQSDVVIAILAALADAPLLAVAFGAGLAVVGSSSLAVVIFVMLLAQTGVVPAPLALCLVAGANVGGAVPPFIAVQAEGLEARRLALANLLVRGIGAIVLTVASGPLAGQVVDVGRMTILGHLGFNLALLVVFLPLIGPVGRLTAWLLPASGAGDAPPTWLDDSLLDSPAMALAVAARETLHLGDTVGAMLDKTAEALRIDNQDACRQVAALEIEVDQRHEAIKMYVARLGRTEMDPQDSQRSQEIIAYAINLEHMGDIIESGLADLASKKIRKKLSFSAEGQAEIADFFARTQANLRLAQATFLSRDPQLARRLVQEKTAVRGLEGRSAARHMARLRDGRTEAIETSSLHIDILRDLKRLNAHLASVAYPVLEERGDLRESRLKAPAVTQQT